MNKKDNTVIEDKCDYLIINFWDSANNYGAMLTSYAIQELIKTFGYVPKILNTGERTHYSWYINSHMEKFANEQLDITNVLSYNQCRELSKNCKGVIVGSDQVLRIAFIRGFFNKYLAAFVPDNIPKIALSASFGMDKKTYLTEQNPRQMDNELGFMKNALSSFSYLSSREYEGVEIFKDLFNLDADLIIDPVFLIDEQKYVELANKSSLDIKDNVFSYVLKNKEKYNKVYDYLSEKLNLPILEIDRFSSQNTYDWLKGIINSKLIITDSFHCVCFAIIFNKPFICVNNNFGGASRFNTLFKLLKTQIPLFTSVDDIYNLKLPFEMNFDDMNYIISSERERCLNRLKDVLINNYSNNQNKIVSVPFKYSKRKWITKYLKYIKYKCLSAILQGKKKISYTEKAVHCKQELDWNKYNY